MLNLLHDCTRSGYPPEYLLSRIRGRMAERIAGKHGVLGKETAFQVDDAGIWDGAVKERKWIFLQMERELRRNLAPVLFYFEMNTIVLCLRSLATRQDGGLAFHCENSLLADELKRIVQVMDEPIETVTKLEQFMGRAGFAMDGLAAAYETGGVQGCEELFRHRFLEQVPAFCTHPEVIHFFRWIIDLKNTMTMAKCLRWNKQEVPVLIPGGYFRVKSRYLVPSEYGLKKMIRNFTGGLNTMDDALHPAKLEPLLSAYLSTVMKRRMRGGDPVACCTGYVWHCFNLTRKWSRDYHASRFAVNFLTASA